MLLLLYSRAFIVWIHRAEVLTVNLHGGIKASDHLPSESESMIIDICEIVGLVVLRRDADV